MEKQKYFTVEIEESYHRTVVILADDEADAEAKADALCNSGEIDLERNCYAGRSVSCSGDATDEDMGHYLCF